VFLGNANAEIEQLQDELTKKSDENIKQNNDILRLSYEVRLNGQVTMVF
jgi:hypothetical protein